MKNYFSAYFPPKMFRFREDLVVSIFAFHKMALPRGSAFIKPNGKTAELYSILQQEIVASFVILSLRCLEKLNKTTKQW